MNLAFPAILLIILLLPGVAAIYAYLGRLGGGDAPDSPLSGLSLVTAIPVSLLLHYIWIQLAPLLTPVTVDVGSVLVLLVGASGESANTEVAFAAIEKHPGWILLYFTSILLCATLGGAAAKRFVVSRELDVKYPFLRFNRWHYLFSGQTFQEHMDPAAGQPAGTLVSAVVEMSGTAWLYLGIVFEYTFDKDGQLDRLTLVGARRRRLEDDAPIDVDYSETFTDDDFEARFAERYYQIQGEFFVLSVRDIKTLGIDYYYLDQDTNE